jgi:hypothetical protein
VNKKSYWWAIGGIVSLLLYAIYRVFPHAAELMNQTLTPIIVLILIVNVGLMLYSEGYKGFQKRFNPRVITRAKQANGLLAPLYALGYYNAPRHELVKSYCFTLLLIVVIIIVQAVPQPWRGILDAGVVVGLTYGTAALIIQSIKRYNR